MDVEEVREGQGFSHRFRKMSVDLFYSSVVTVNYKFNYAVTELHCSGRDSFKHQFFFIFMQTINDSSLYWGGGSTIFWMKIQKKSRGDFLWRDTAVSKLKYIFVIMKLF